MKPRALVVGVGRPRLGDDALGLEVAQRLKERLAGTVRVVLDPSTGWEALAALGDEPLLILIDAAESSPRLPPGESCRPAGAPPGRVPGSRGLARPARSCRPVRALHRAAPGSSRLRARGRLPG